MSLSVLRFLESSSSIGTGIAITHQAFRHLVEGDEKNMRCGMGRGEATGKSAGDRILLGVDILLCRSNVWLERDVMVSVVSPLKI